MAPGLIAFLLFEVALLVVGIVGGVKIIIKAGYSGWWFLVFLLPLAGFIMFVVFAFAKWPVQQRLEQAERRLWSGAPNVACNVAPGRAPSLAQRGRPQGWAQPLSRACEPPRASSWDYLG